MEQQRHDVEPSMKRNMVIVRAFLQGRRKAVIARGFGISVTRVTQVINLSLWRIDLHAHKATGESISHEQFTQRRDNPKEWQAYWLTALGRYEADHDVCTLNEPLPYETLP